MVSLDDPAAACCRPARSGEFAIRGPNVSHGYWNRPEETAEAFLDGCFLTGDIGVMDADGCSASVDRKKDMIISGGFNVYPPMIENAIYEHPGVQEVIVIGMPDDYRGEAAKAFVKLRDGRRAVDAGGAAAFLARRLRPPLNCRTARWNCAPNSPQQPGAENCWPTVSGRSERGTRRYGTREETETDGFCAFTRRGNRLSRRGAGLLQGRNPAGDRARRCTEGTICQGGHGRLAAHPERAGLGACRTGRRNRAARLDAGAALHLQRGNAGARRCRRRCRSTSAWSAR